MNNSQDTKNSQPEQEKERCVGCEACIDTACGRDECPKGWPKAAQPEQEPVEVFLTDQHQMGFKAGVQSFLLDYWPDEQAELEFMKTQLLTAFAKAKAPQRTWVGLTPQERDEINEQVYGAVPHHVAFHHAIEAKLKEKNGL